MRDKKGTRVLCSVLAPAPGIIDIAKLCYILDGDAA